MNHIEKVVFASLIILFSSGFSATTSGQAILLKQSSDNGIYQSGQSARITLLLQKIESDSVTVAILRDFTEWQTRSIVNTGSDTLELFSEVLSGPATYIFEARVNDQFASIGLIVDPEKYTPGTKRPGDFNRYWNREKRRLKASQRSTVEEPLPVIDSGYLCFNVELSSTAPEPARGYFAKPVTANAKSLPIVVYFHAAGVSGDWCRSEPEIALRYSKMGKGALAFDLNAHGMLNGQPDEYYTSLENGKLKNYAQQGLEDRNNIYFRGMYLRLLSTLDFLTSQPEWDGKRILVIGESQGGGQALAAAGLDKRVSAVIATVPAMCDWGGSLIGRKGSWPYPFETENNRGKMLAALPYFDVAHILKGSRATIVAEIGLIDLTCPSSAVFAALNQAKGKKIIFTVPYRAHHMTQPEYNETWENNVLRQVDALIHEYLK